MRRTPPEVPPTPTDAPSQAPRAWQRMLSGRRLDLLAPRPEDIEIDDIAHGLARVARWNGQTSGAHALSVAQHSLLVEDIVAQLAPNEGRELALTALLHDAPEYVIGDLISPFKAAIGSDYKSVEHRLFAAILIRFELASPPADHHLQAIKAADRIAAYFEATAVAGFAAAEALELFGNPTQLPVNTVAQLKFVDPLDASSAQKAFLARFHQLTA